MLSISTIYRAVRRSTFPGISARENLRCRGKNRNYRNYVHHNTAIRPMRLILEWRTQSRFVTVWAILRATQSMAGSAKVCS